MPFGGAKGGVRVDPKDLSPAELGTPDPPLRTSEIHILLGQDKDIPAPDINTNEQVMAWVMDTYSMNEGRTAMGVVTGKPVGLGGSLGRRDATGRGVFVSTAEAARRLGLEIAGARVAIQGFGNVGDAAAPAALPTPARVVALQDDSGSIANPGGFDVRAVKAWRLEHGALEGAPGPRASQPMISGPPTPTSWWPQRWKTRSPPPTPADPRPPDHRRRQRPTTPKPT